MTYTLALHGETIPVEVVRAEKNRMEARIKESGYTVEFNRLDTRWLHLRVNGKGANIYVHPDDGGKTVVINGTPYVVRDADRLEMSGSRKIGGAKEATRVTPPMPAVVMSVAVEQGERVEKGQPAVVVSAMKMETVLAVPYDGIVEKVNVAEGSKVMPGDILVDITPLGNEAGGVDPDQSEGES